MQNRSCKFPLAVIAATCSMLLSGCAAKVPVFQPMDDIYDEVHGSGARDAVTVLREGLRERMAYGVTDAYIPLRTPDQVVPIWVFPYEDPRTARRVDGHWEHTVLRSSEWFTE